MNFRDFVAMVFNNFSQHTVDSSIKKNASFATGSGVKAKIVRKTSGKCCDWCTQLAGTYDADSAPDDIYLRHSNCDCTIEYIYPNGKVKNAHSKAEHDLSAQELEKLKEESVQNYKKVERGKSITISDRKFINLKARRITTYESEVYVSDNASIKPKALHDVNMRTEEALKEYGVPAEEKPRLVIVSTDEMPTAWGRYDAVNNAVYYVSDIDRATENVEYHEMWHAKQAYDYRKAGGDITEATYGKYMQELQKKCKKRLDKEGVTEYNVGSISMYAEEKYHYGRYDETEAELMAKRHAKRGE